MTQEDGYLEEEKTKELNSSETDSGISGKDFGKAIRSASGVLLAFLIVILVGYLLLHLAFSLS